MIEARGVTKSYGDFVALQDVSFNIGKGEVVGLLGPNGAGKTTLLRILTGYFEPSGGQVRVDGFDVVEDSLEAQGRIGYLPEQTPLYPEMLVQEYLDMVADLRGLPRGSARMGLLGEAVWATGLEQHLTHPIASLSRGFRQRVGIAQAILHKPKVLVLDEPTSGLDPSQVVLVRELIRRLAQTTTVLFSTHILSEVEQVCERAIIMLAGRIRCDARLDEIQASHAAQVAVALDSVGGAAATRAEDVGQALVKLDGITEVKQVQGMPGYLRYEIAADVERDLCREVFRLAKQKGWEVGELFPMRKNLETVFRELVSQSGAASAAEGKSGKGSKATEVRA